MGKYVSVLGACMVIAAMITTLPRLFTEMTSSLDHVSTRGENTAPSAPQAPSQPIDWGSIGVGAAIVVLVGVTAVAVVTAWRVTAARRRRRARQIEAWSKGEKAFAEASNLLWDFEKDPMSVYFIRPLLADTNERASAEFYTAYAAANDLHTEAMPTDDDLIDEFAAAAKDAVAAFHRADESARRKARLGIGPGDHLFTVAESKKVDQARKLLAAALDPAATPSEATTAHDRALRLLDDVGVVIPERLVTKVTLSLEAAHRQAITAA